MRKVIHIGLPELSDEELAEVADIAHETVVNEIRESISSSDIIDLDVVVRVTREETLDLSVEAYVEVPIFIGLDVEGIVEEALDSAYARVEEWLRRKACGERSGSGEG
ncbi:MAG: DUF3194 domain-containing protein [Thermococci archaeon]|nr:DUF3194 domain-containing protein [Thermococci archaeon]